MFLLPALGLFGLAPLSIFFALQGLPMDIVFMSDALTVALVVLLSVVILKERVSRRGIYGVIFIVLGIIVYNFKLEFL